MASFTEKKNSLKEKDIGNGQTRTLNLFLVQL